MKLYLRLKAAGLGFVGLLLVIGYASLPLPGNEFFPFYSWSMFSLVPHDNDAFTIFIKKSPARVLIEPVEFQQASGLVNGCNSVVAYRVIQKLGAAYQARQEEELKRYRELFEKNYLPPGTHYALMKTHYDPLSRWQNQGRTLEPLDEWAREK